MPQDYEVDFMQDDLDLHLPDDRDIDLISPTELKEVKTLEFDTDAINNAIIKGSDGNENDKRRLINLHIASKINKHPNKMNYDAAVKSYFHGDAADSSVDQVFQKLQGAIKPEIDADYKALEEFQSLTEEEQLNKIITTPERPSDYGISVGGMGAVYIPSAVKDETPQDRQAQAIAGMSQEEKDAAITKYGMDLLGKSRRAMIETGEKVLSPFGRRMADKMSLGKKMSLVEYNQLTGMDKNFIFEYTRAINPALDTSQQEVLFRGNKVLSAIGALNPIVPKSTLAHLYERTGQTLTDGGESMAHSIQRVAGQKDSPQRVYEEFMTGFDAAELDQFADSGEWSSPEFEAKADAIIDEIAEGMVPHAYSRSRIRMGESSEALRAQVKKDIKEKLKPELQKKLYEGRELANQFKLDRAIKAATRKLFKAGPIEDVIVEGTTVLVDMGIAIGAGIPTAGTGTVAYSATRVYGDFVNTLIYDHNVDPDDAIAIGTVGTAVYAGIELAQAKTLAAPFKKTSAKVKGIQSEMAQKFMAKLPDFAKKIATSKSPVMQGIRETAKTYTLETAEESLQAMTEQLMKAYAKEFAEAEGVEYSELVGDWFDETLSAMKGMALMSVGRGVVRTGKEMGGYDNQTMKDNILKDPGNLDFKTISDDFAKLPQELQEELQEAETREDIQAIFDENNIVMKAEDFQSFQDLQSEVGVEVDTQKQELRQEVEQKSADVDVDYIDVNRDLKKVQVKAQAQSFIKPMSEYVDLLEPTPGNFVIKSKANNNSVQLEFVEPNKLGKKVAGQYSDGKIILPANAKDFTFNHEMFHGMFDLGVITADEQRILIKSAIRRLDTDAISDRYKDKYNQVKSSLLKEFEAEGKTNAAFMINEIAPEFTSAIQNEEFMAHLVEQAAKDPNFFKDMSPDEKTVWQKLIDFIKSLYSSQYRSELKSEKATAETVKRNRRKEAEADKILQSILTGEVMSREGPKSQVDMDDVYASEYDADIADEINYMMGQIEPDAAAESRLKEDAEREEATAELFKTSVAPVNEVKLFLADRTFKFDEKFKEEVEQLSPAEKRRINKFEDAESSVSSDNVFDELVEATILDDTATVTEMIEQLARPIDANMRYSINEVADKNLIAVHNLSQENLKATEEFGGLAAPSVGIVRADLDTGLNFGEISLVASPDLIDPKKGKGGRAFDADIYSPRFPKDKIIYEINRSVRNDIDNFISDEIKELSDSTLDAYGLEYEGINRLSRSHALKLKYAREVKNTLKRLPKDKKEKFPKDIIAMTKGKSFEELDKISDRKEFRDLVDGYPELTKMIVARKKRVEEASNDAVKAKMNRMLDLQYHTIAIKAEDSTKPAEINRLEAKKLIDAKVPDEDVINWVKSKWPDLVKSKKLFKGYSNKGDKLTEDLTMANVLKIMNKPPLKGGEGTPGPSQLRGQSAREFGSLEDIKQSRGQILPAGDDIEQIKEDLSQEFWNLTEDLEPYYKWDFSPDAVAESLGQYVLKGRRELYKDFEKNTPIKEIDEYIDKLRNAPTEYFEVKFLREVGVNEFDLALVPKGPSYKESVDILKNNGLKVVRYDSGEARDFSIDRLKKFRFSIPGASDKDLAAISLAGHQFETKKDFTQNQLNKALDDLGIVNETERLEVIQRADTILNELNESKSELSNHREITEALIEANLNAEYQEGLSRIERESFKGGKTYERAAAKLKERAKIARLADTQDLEPDKIAYLINEYQKSITENEDSSRLLPSIKDAIRENMIKSGLITERNKKGFEKMPEYRATLGKTLNAISINLIRQITPGRRKNSLNNKARRLRDLTTTKAIESNFNKLLKDISDSKVIDDKATLKDKFKSLLNSAAVKEREKSAQELIHSKTTTAKKEIEKQEKILSGIKDKINKARSILSKSSRKDGEEKANAYKSKIEALRESITELKEVEDKKIRKEKRESLRKEIKELQRKVKDIEAFSNKQNAAIKALYRSKKNAEDKINELKKVGLSSLDKALSKSIEPMVRRELNLIKQVAKISKVEADVIRDRMFEFYNDPSDLEGQSVGDMFKAYESQFPAFKKYNHLEPVDRAVILGNAAAEFGGFNEKTEIEMSDAVDSITGLIEGSQKNIEDLINKKNAVAQPRRDALANLKGKRRGEWGRRFDRFLFSSFGMRSAFQDITRQATEEQGEAAKEHLDEMLANWNDAIHARDVAIMTDHQELSKAVKEKYGVDDDWAILKYLNTKKKEYAHLSKHGDDISKFQVMQLYASAVQQDYLENASINNRQAGKYLKVLSKQDLEMIQWFRDYYAKERGALSEQMEKMTGVPIEMIDPFYVPVKVESNQAGLGTEINATAIIPPGMVKRVDHKLDFDESAGMFEIWARKVEENNHFKYTADAAVEMRSVFSTKPVHEAMEYNFGKSYKNAFMTLIKDNINNGGPSTYDLKAIDTIRGAWTASKFALNARIGIRQTTSIPAFGLELGLVETAKHVKSFWSDEGFKAVREIWNSDLRKERWGSGNTEAINNAIGGMGSHTTMSKWVKKSMFFNNLGDMVPTLIVGQGIYRSYTKTYMEQGATSIEEAKSRALSRTFQIVESTQQSSKLKDMAEWQRRGGSLGKMAAQFTNTTRQFLERDFTDIRAFLADPKNKIKQKRAASTVFINHVLLPGAYNGMNMIINMIMGDDIDEEDWWLMFASMISGPMSGFIVFGSMITGAIETGVTGRAPWGNKSLTPFAGIKDDLNNVVLATEGILTTDWEQFDKAFTKLMKSLFAPYREVSKVMNND